ncbi:MAG TPA: DUF5309 family protein [Hyphomicrobiaceae bacterium]|nr:DUF5309 family protein [Hyphomicrobiaceae bacterium]
MAVPTNTIQAVGRVGVREDLSDRIGELFPDDAPVKRAIGTGPKAGQVYTEWQTDGLVAANANNASIQGDDLPNENRPNTVRVGNYTQIMTKVVSSSTTLEASNKAGRRSELAREIMKAGKEIQTDQESAICSNNPAVPPAAGTAGKVAGMCAWIRTNVSRGAGGANGTYSGGTSGYVNAGATNGTLRTYTEALIKPVLASAWAAGGNPKMVVTSIGLKQTAATFPGIAQQRRETGNKRATIVAGADFYVSDVGEVQFVPSRFTTNRDALIIDPEYWEIAYLDPLQMRDLAVTGLANRKAMYMEWTMRSLNERASAVIADVQP